MLHTLCISLLLYHVYHFSPTTPNVHRAYAAVWACWMRIWVSSTYSRRNLGFMLPTLAFPAHNLSCPSGIALPAQDFLLIPLLSLFYCFLKSFLSFFRDACPASQPVRPNWCSEADKVFERGGQSGWGKVPGSSFWQPRRECLKSHHLMWHSVHIFTLKYQE